MITSNRIIRIWLEDGGWMSQDSDPEVVALFGTDTLPTPFLASTPVSMVVDTLERLNPGADVRVGRDESRSKKGGSK